MFLYFFLFIHANHTGRKLIVLKSLHPLCLSPCDKHKRFKLTLPLYDFPEEPCKVSIESDSVATPPHKENKIIQRYSL